MAPEHISLLDDTFELSRYTVTGINQSDTITQESFQVFFDKQKMGASQNQTIDFSLLESTDCTADQSNGRTVRKRLKLVFHQIDNIASPVTDNPAI